jgi:hypothetical protein
MKAVTSALITPMTAPTRHSRPAVLTNEGPAVEDFFIDVTPSLLSRGQGFAILDSLLGSVLHVLALFVRYCFCVEYLTTGFGTDAEEAFEVSVQVALVREAARRAISPTGRALPPSSSSARWTRRSMT